MTMHTKVGGAWKDITEAHTKVGGSWKEITEGWTKVGGVWKQFYANFIPQLSECSDPLSATGIAGDGNRTIASIRFNLNGDIEEATGDEGAPLSYSTVGTWVNRTSGLDNTDWEIKVTIDSEDTGASGTWTGSTIGSFLELSTTRRFSWEKDTDAVGTASSDITIQVRQKSDTGNSATRAGITYSAEEVL